MVGTANLTDAGTTDPVYLTIVGEMGESRQLELNCLEAGSSKTFTFEMGDWKDSRRYSVKYIRLHAGESSFDDWKGSYIRLERFQDDLYGEYYVFIINDWLTNTTQGKCSNV